MRRLAASVLIALFCCLCARAATPALDEGFREPPPDARPLAWWHWMNGSISRDGIAADLADMQKMGIAGVQILDVDTKLPDGPVRYGTDAWFEHLQFALQTARKHGLTVTIHNCPGWSTTGGPWVKLEDSMKKLVWSELTLEGGRAVNQKLPDPPAEMGFYRDVYALAVPADSVDDGQKPTISCSSDKVKGLESLVDGDNKSAIDMPKGTGATSFTFTFDKPVERRMLEIRYPFYEKGVNVHWDARIEASDDGVKFRKLADIGYGGMLFRGGDIIIAAPFPATIAKVFRVIAKSEISPLNISEIRFSSAHRIDNYKARSGFGALGRIPPIPFDSLSDPSAIPMDKVIDLSSRLSADGAMNWDAPPGRWTILRIGFTTTGMTNHPSQKEGTGPEVDKMDARAVREHLDHAMGRILKDAGPLVGSTLVGMLVDSYESRQQNWTPAFAKEFEQRRGYSLVPFMPAITGRIVKSLADTDAFLRDYRRTISELFAENHYAVMHKFAAEHGLKFYSEAYGGRAFDEFLSGRACDVPMGEFWYGKEPGRIKAVASLAHTYGKPIVAAEAFTAVAQDAGYSKTPFDLKPFGDQAFALGLNQMMLHSYTHQPRSDLPPGFANGSSGSNFGRLNTWWPLAKPWLDYLARCQWMLRQGRFVGDVLFLRNTEMGSFGEDRYPDLPPGVDGDQVDEQMLAKATVVDGRIQLPTGMRYRVLVLPKMYVADRALLSAIEKLAASGVPVIGTVPVAPAGRADLAGDATAWKSAVASLKSRLKPATSLAQLMPEPDFTFEPAESKISYSHREGADFDLYFVCNPGPAPAELTANFRVSGRRAELWDPVSGEISPVAAVSRGGRTSLKLSLEPAGSIFVVFRNSASIAVGAPRSAVESAAPLELSPSWTVKFKPPTRDSFERKFDKLHLWGEDPDEVIRYFSGQAVYEATVDVPAERLGKGVVCQLDLGRVFDLAEVRINGKPGRGLWKPPFTLDVTDLLQPGANTLQITVANRWTNRLMGDNFLPPDIQYQTKFKSNPKSYGLIEQFPDWYNDPVKIRQRQRQTFPMYNPYFKPNAKPVDAGLAGPVVIRFLAPMTPEGDVQR